jgi:hypothetical protein
VPIIVAACYAAIAAVPFANNIAQGASNANYDNYYLCI